MSDLHYDPLSAQIAQDPYPTYAALRRHAPVYRSESGWFALSRYDDVRSALQCTADFSSAAMQELLMAVGDDEPGFEPRTLIGTDPPHHTAIRKIVNRGFTRRRIAQLEQRIRTMAEELVAPMVSRGGGDLVAELAAPVPVMVIAEMLGIDPERRGDFRRWSDDLIGVLGGRSTPAELERSRQSLDELSDYLEEIIVERKRRPRNDLISALVGAEQGDGALDENEARFFAELLLIAGNETTTYLIANALQCLMQHPEQLQMVAAQPELIPNVVEETLRFSPPAHLTLRTATRDLEIHKTTIPKGAKVILLLASANRDDSVFPRASRFDIRRDPSGHLSFGSGTHFCLGAPLARLEARVVLEVLLQHAGELRLLDAEVPRKATLLIHGAERLRVAITPRHAVENEVRKSA